MLGKHICFCGLDGSGKTTQANYLRDYIIAYGGKCEIVHGFKPGKHNSELKEYAKKNGSSFCEVYTNTIRSVSYMCDMYENYYEKIKPLLENGYIVISDKFVMDSIVNAPLLGANEDLIKDFAGIIPKPDMYIYTSIGPEEAYKRIQKRKLSESESLKNDKNFMKKSYMIYEKLEKLYEKIYIINAEQSEEKVKQDIIKLLKIQNIILN